MELVFFAPIGFALEAKSLLPTFIERGRQQVMMAKVVGRFAVSQGQTVGRKRLSKAQAQAESLMAEFGLGPAAPNGSASGAGESTTPERSAGADAAAAAVVEASSPRVAQSSAASGDLAIADYDSLAASQVIPRLAGLDAGELEAVRVYETAHRARTTILGRIAQLQGS